MVSVRQQGWVTGHKVAPIVTLAEAIAATEADGDTVATEGVIHLTSRVPPSSTDTGHQHDRHRAGGYDLDACARHSATATEKLLRCVLVAGYLEPRSHEEAASKPLLSCARTSPLAHRG
jgi:hypothetical protein